MTYPYLPTTYHGGSQTSVTRIVIHATVSPCMKGGARNVARYFQSPGTGGSAHYVVDPAEIVQCVKEGTVAYHAPPNANSIGIELCDPQAGAAARWGDPAHEAMLVRAAGLVREVAGRWGVPLTKLTAAQLKAGHHGICGHADVSAAWHETDHVDPGEHGPFPWAHFMQLITGAPKPPAPTPEEDPDMPYGQLDEGPKAITPIALPKGRYKTIGFIADNGLQQLPPASLRVAINHGGHWFVQTVTVDSAKGQTVVTFTDPGNTVGISVRREDAGDVHVAWEVS